MRRLGAGEGATRLRRTAADTLAFLSFQLPIYWAILAFAGASLRQIAASSVAATAVILVSGRPYGLVLDLCRRLMRVPTPTSDDSLPGPDRRERARPALTARVGGVSRRYPPYPEVVTFEDVVRSALDELPPAFSRALENVALVVEEENPDDPDIYGLFEGIPLVEGGPQPGDLPNRIAVYRRPLTEDFTDPDELREEIRITVLHELGHAIGLDEDRLEELGYG